ncbi:MAG: hypothetical protein WAK00_08595 [Microbacterium sp.]|uniref:hypothetical protein n=1 Tax=Microbacterium sp. TaxID=51671 RepID=UPI003BB1E970
MMAGLGGLHLVMLLLVYALSAVAVGTVIYFAVLFALKSHTRWVDQGKPGRSRSRSN